MLRGTKDDDLLFVINIQCIDALCYAILIFFLAQCFYDCLGGTSQNNVYIPSTTAIFLYKRWGESNCMGQNFDNLAQRKTLELDHFKNFLPWSKKKFQT